MRLHHVIQAQQFNPEILEELFNQADEMEELIKSRHRIAILRGKGMASLFYQPSSRTRASFEIAMRKLGGEVIFSTENAREFSSAAKGETLEDTIRIISGYFPDVIVLRHFESGAAARAAEVSQVPIINAGDGPGQHPTQALLDLYTIKKEIHHINGISIAMVGDLANGRTVRSLSYLLSKFSDIRIFFVAPEVVRMKEDIKEHLKENHTWFSEETDLKKVIPQVDIIYQTRIQRECFRDRIEDYEKARGIYIINKETLELMKKDGIIMHPLPRLDEIKIEVDKDPRAAYFRQAQNGLFIRMALLKMILI